MAISERDKSGTRRWIEKLQRSIGNLDSIEMEESDRLVIRRCLESEREEATDRLYENESKENDGKPWTSDELDAIRKFLSSRNRFRRGGRSISCWRNSG